MPNIGPMEIAIVLIIALIVIGPKKLPSFGRSAGKSLREFKQSVSGDADPDSAAGSAGRSVRELREAIVHDDDEDEKTKTATAKREEKPREPVAAAPRTDA